MYIKLILKYKKLQLCAITYYSSEMAYVVIVMLGNNYAVFKWVSSKNNKVVGTGK